MKWTGIYLLGFVILIGGLLAALWEIGLLARIGTTWTMIGVVIAIGIGIMLSVSSGRGSSFIDSGGLAMYQIWLAIFLATTLLVGQAIAADRTQKAAAAEGKAGVLEQDAAGEGSKTLPFPAKIITKPEAQAVDPVGEEPLNDAITCLSRTIFWETKSEEVASMEAIANVVMNRLGHEGFPNTICEVVKQGQEQGACQFSWWCDGRSDDAEEDKSYAIAKETARKALNRQLTDRTSGAMYFHQKKATPSWSAKYIKTVEVGRHVFYKPHGGKAE